MRLDLPWVIQRGLASLLAATSIACSSSGAQSPSGPNDAAGTDMGSPDVRSPDAGPPDSGPGADGSSGDGGAPMVTINTGQLAGRSDGSVYGYLGIPYAQPPTGALRWKEPQPPKAWTGVRDATNFGKRCAQNANPTLQTAASADEDCLYVNVWTPNPSASKLPVMVWIHGGGNVGGSTSDPVPFADGGYFYSGATLAGNGVVVVSLNYRLGVFGFFAHPGLIGEGSKAANQGLWDQRFALQWVQTNIAKFGGDPSNVTIFGESAGSLDVCLHVASPQMPPLFERAISESGGCTTHQSTLLDEQGLVLTLAAQLGCDVGATTDAGAASSEGGATDASVAADGSMSDASNVVDGSSDGGAATAALDCLRNVSVQTLLAMAANVDGGGMLGPFEPVVDNDFLADQPRTLYKSGKIAKTPYLLGSNSDEGTLFELSAAPVTDQAGLNAALTKQFGDAGPAVANLYPVSEFDGGVPNPYQAALTRVVGDSILVCSTYDSAILASSQGAATYMYNFDIPVVIPGVVGTSPGELYLGASHGSELSFVFGTSPQFAMDTGQSMVSQLMERYWTRFAAKGDPNGGSDLMWPQFSAMNDVRMQFSLQPSIVTGFRSAECNFWIGQYQAQFDAAGP